MRTTSSASTLRPDSGIGPVWTEKFRLGFDPAAFLENAGVGKTVVKLKRKEPVFSQGDPADAVFFIQKGHVRLTFVSQNGEEAPIALFGAGDFIGEECIVSAYPTRMASAAALMECTALRIDRKELLRVLHEEPAFSDRFVCSLLARSARFEADLVD